NHARVREECKTIFSAPRLSSHPYLTKKGVQAHGQLVLSRQTITEGWLALPLIDETGVIHSAQCIAPDGIKRNHYQGRKNGCWFAISDASDGPICIAEGYATGASVHEATGWATVCALDAGNLLAVAKAIRKIHP